jgi:hypothetical protein
MTFFARFGRVIAFTGGILALVLSTRKIIVPPLEANTERIVARAIAEEQRAGTYVTKDRYEADQRWEKESLEEIRATTKHTQELLEQVLAGKPPRPGWRGGR